MEDLQKLLILDETFREIDCIQGITSYQADIDSVQYESNLSGNGSLQGIKGYYIVVPESFDYDECINEGDIIHFYRDKFIDKLSKECTNVIESGFEFEGDTFGYDSKDQSNFNEQLLLLTLDDDEEEIEWKIKDKGYKTYDKETFIRICKQAKQHKNFYKKKLNEIKTKVYDFEKVENLFSISSFLEEVEKITN